MNRLRYICLAALFALLTIAHPAALQAAFLITPVYGNGQLAKANCSLCTAYTPDFQPLVVLVTDSNGIPQANVAVNWTVTQGFTVALSEGTTTNTDAAGYARNDLQYTTSLQLRGVFQQFEQNTVVASTIDNSTTFTLTAASPPVFNSQGQLTVPIIINNSGSLQDLLGGNILTGQAGTASTTPLSVRVGGSSGTPVPNASIQLVSLQDPASGPTVTCKENQGGQNMALSDANGVATCTPQFGGTPCLATEQSCGRFYVLIGYGGTPVSDLGLEPPQATTIGFATPIRLKVTAATPTNIKSISGNAQSANQNQTLPLPLVVEVVSSTGLPIAGQDVRWTANPAGAISFLSDTVTKTDLAGRASMVLRFTGIANGAIQITATVVANPSLTQTFTLTASPVVTVTGISIFSGNNQSAPVGSAFAQPLVVQVSTSSGSAAGNQVQFTSTGSISLSSSSATTDANGRAQVTVTAGTLTGPATVTASIFSNTGSGSQTFSLTVLPPAPSITSGNFVNGADQQANSLSPCSIGSIVAPGGTLSVANATPIFAGQAVIGSSAQLSINNINAAILAIATLPNGNQAISFQVPCEVPAGSSVPASLNLGGGTTTLNLNIQAASPGIFQTLSADSVLRTIVVRPDGSYVTLSNPARRGETVSIFVTGLGPTNPAVGTGSLPPPGTAANVLGTVVVGMAGSGVQVVSAKLTEDLPGVYLVTFQIPSDMQTGSNVSISVALIPANTNTAIYSATTKIIVQ